MEARFVTTGDVPQISGCAARYWVRFWAPPTVAQGSWFVDEWEVSDAPDVLAVIEWARKQTAPHGSFEVFVEHTELALRSDSEYVPVKRHIRIYGGPADDGGVMEEVTFTAK